MDSELFLFIFGFARQWFVLDGIAIFFAAYAIFFLFLLCLVGAAGNRRVLACMLFSAILAYAINAGIGALHFRQRPFVAFEQSSLITVDRDDKSFPSDHTAVSFALAVAVGLVSRAWLIPLVLIAFLIGLSRVFVGVHYPGDIFAGIGVGALSAVMISAAINTVNRRKVRVPWRSL
ncbi:phosphatase PAP2 family protein [Candidatus Uhrbacteria bacterium]|nr:phosphatase PAP2 family protein [Candidatus Uhrbacteria bacterium]